MNQGPRTLHKLEKIVAVFALAAVLALTIGFAQAARPGKHAAARHADAQAEAAAERLQREQPDKVFLRSTVALVQDASSGETILVKNAGAVLPIASITKLMTAMVLLDGKLNLAQRVAVSGEDQDALKGTRSRLRPGAVLTRDELLLLALMASENRAAAALARTYPGGTERFVQTMNVKAQMLGMQDTRFSDPTGLSSANVSSAQDLARLVSAAHEYPVIRQYSTRDSATVYALGRPLAYRNTNGLVRSSDWDIGLSKTGFISEAGRCLVMRVRVSSKDLVVVLLDSWGKYSRIGDANRIRKWLETSAAAGRRT
jgi:D-alanyl-D-alanine endopeptidase (penicillin-binding protein 7)